MQFISMRNIKETLFNSLQDSVKKKKVIYFSYEKPLSSGRTKN